MEQRIVVVVTGDVRNVLRAWPAPAGVEIVQRDDDAHVVLYSRDDLAALREVATLFSAELVPFFQAFDFTAADLDAAPMLAMHARGGPTLEMEPLVDEHRCRICGEWVWRLRDVDHVAATTDDEVTGTFLRAGDDNLSAVLFHRDFLRSLPRAHGLATIAVTINGTNDSYALARGTVNLGWFAGGVRHAPPCEECGRPELLANDNFLATYRRPTVAADFACSRVHGPLSLVISQAVYRHIVETRALQDRLALTPVQLDDA